MRLPLKQKHAPASRHSTSPHAQPSVIDYRPWYHGGAAEVGSSRSVELQVARPWTARGRACRAVQCDDVRALCLACVDS